MKIVIAVLFSIWNLSGIAQRLPQSALLIANSRLNAQSDEVQSKCEKYRRMKLSGIILCSTGAGIFVAGAVTGGIGFVGSFGERFGRSSNTGPLLIGGASCLGLGAVCVFSGLPLIDIGSRKMKRCRGQSLILSTNGSNLALSF